MVVFVLYDLAKYLSNPLTLFFINLHFLCFLVKSPTQHEIVCVFHQGSFWPADLVELVIFVIGVELVGACFGVCFANVSIEVRIPLF